MNSWEYKLKEFTGTADAFPAWLTQEKTDAWEVGALLPGPSKQVPIQAGSMGTTAATGICIIFKRQIPTQMPILSAPAIAFH